MAGCQKRIVHCTQKESICAQKFETCRKSFFINCQQFKSAEAMMRELPVTFQGV